MENLDKFDSVLSRVPRKGVPLRVILAGSDGENMLKGIFRAQKDDFVQPVLVGDRARTLAMLEKLGLRNEPYTMVDVPPTEDVAKAAINIIQSGDGDVLMRGNIPTLDFMAAVLREESGLRTNRFMSHVSLASLPEYPKLIALSDMTVMVNPDINQKKDIIRNMTDCLRAFGCEHPVLAVMALVEYVTLDMPDTEIAYELVHAHKRKPIADCELWGPIAYDLIMSKEAARLKGYDCLYSGGGFDGILAQNLIAGNTLVKSWLIHGHAVTCGAVVGAKVPIALTSRSAAEEETYLSLAFCAALREYQKNLTD